jgi:hypothetical protein
MLCVMKLPVGRRRARQAERVREEQLALARSWDAAHKALSDPARRAQLVDSLARLDELDRLTPAN